MNICELYNLTVGVYSNTYVKLLFTEDSKTLKGQLAKYFQPYFTKKKISTNKCTLINIFETGEKLKNGSYDGALGAIERKEIDLYFKIEIPFTNREHFFFSHPINSEKFFILQVINQKELDKFEYRIQLVKSFDHQYVLYYFLAILLFIVFLLAFYKNMRKTITKKIKLILVPALNISKILSNESFKLISLLLCGQIWFNFFTTQILTNNIKTSKVIVDTSELITNEKEVFKNPLKAAWIKGESDLSIVKNAPNNTFLKKLYLLKNEKPIKFSEKELKPTTFKDLYGHFFLLRSFILKLLINLISPLQEKDVFYINKPFYEVFSVFYIRKHIKTKKFDFLYR